MRQTTAEAVKEFSAELHRLQSNTCLAIAKLIHGDTGEPSGEFLCPVCRSSQLRWLIHGESRRVEAICKRKTGKDTFCVAITEGE